MYCNIIVSVQIYTRLQGHKSSQGWSRGHQGVPILEVKGGHKHANILASCNPEGQSRAPLQIPQANTGVSEDSASLSTPRMGTGGFLPIVAVGDRSGDEGSMGATHGDTAPVSVGVLFAGPVQDTQDATPYRQALRALSGAVLLLGDSTRNCICLEVFGQNESEYALGKNAGKNKKSLKNKFAHDFFTPCSRRLRLSFQADCRER
ncbi:hypothetical protein AAMO2058_000077800 [Amorphochlora amoebiformis]